MPKSLGQIHTVNFSKTVNASGDIKNCDISGELTSQLSKMVRQGQNFKVVGIDMAMTTEGLVGGGQVSGQLRYYAPTKGRCEAYRGAFIAMKKAMSLQGINPSNNAQYDFRVGFNDLGPQLADGGTIENQATLNGSTPLVLHSLAGQVPESNVFFVHNSSVQPRTTTSTNLFPAGFNSMGVQNTPTDFVLNDSVMFTGNENSATTTYESIPFMMSWTPDTTDLSIAFNWRPDPALYLAVMTGQFQLYIEEINKDGGSAAVEIEMAIHIAGWKSMMSSPSKKSRRSPTSSSKKTSRSRK
jgi:hypothetical protein